MRSSAWDFRRWVQIPLTAKPNRFTSQTLTGRLLLPADQMDLDVILEPSASQPPFHAPDARLVPPGSKLEPSLIRRPSFAVHLGNYSIVIHTLAPDALPGVQATDVQRHLDGNTVVRWSVPVYPPSATNTSRANTPPFIRAMAAHLPTLTATSPEALLAGLKLLEEKKPATLLRMIRSYPRPDDKHSNTLARAFPHGLPPEAVAALLASSTADIREATLLALSGPMQENTEPPSRPARRPSSP